MSTAGNVNFLEGGEKVDDDYDDDEWPPVILDAQHNEKKK